MLTPLPARLRLRCWGDGDFAAGAMLTRCRCDYDFAAGAVAAREQSVATTCRVRSARLLRGACGAQDVAHRVVSLVARVLEHPFRLRRQIERRRPWLGPRLRIVDGDFVAKAVVRTGVALDEVQRAAGAAVVGLVA